MKPTLTDITVLLDRSGSMDIIKNDTIGGFNAFLKTQVESPGEAVLTLAQFDTVYEEVHHAKPIKDVPELNGHTFVPRGGTALYYSLVRLIDETGKRLSEMNEADRPGMVVFVIITEASKYVPRTADSPESHSTMQPPSNVVSTHSAMCTSGNSSSSAQTKMQSPQRARSVSQERTPCPTAQHQ